MRPLDHDPVSSQHSLLSSLCLTISFSLSEVPNTLSIYLYWLKPRHRTSAAFRATDSQAIGPLSPDGSAVHLQPAGSSVRHVVDMSSSPKIAYYPLGRPVSCHLAAGQSLCFCACSASTVSLIAIDGAHAGMYSRYHHLEDRRHFSLQPSQVGFCSAVTA